MRKAPERVLHVMAPTPPIRMGAQRRSDRTRLEAASTLFLRSVAILWFAEGAMQWLAVLADPGGAVISDVTPQHITAVVFFCILDFVAVVGLWLVSTWGVAVWLTTILGHIVVTALGAGVLAEPVVLIASDMALVAAYAALAWLTARERRRA